jgi:hypothetical protein
VAVVQYTFTHKQYIKQHNRHKQYVEQHNSLIRKNADRAPSLRDIPWHLLTTEEKARKNLSQGSMCVCVVCVRARLFVCMVALSHQEREEGASNLLSVLG